MAVTPQRMTLARFLELPEVKPALELRQGVVSQKMPPSGPHGSIQMWFGAQVYNYGELRGLAQAFTETRVILGKDAYVPDVIVYVPSRIQVDERGRYPFYFTIPPDLIVEVASPGQTVRSLLDRCEELIAHGVRVALLVDPERMAVHVVRPSGAVGPLSDDDAVDISDIVPGFDLHAIDLLSRVGPGFQRG